ncbi:hypothetical protein Syun_022908 [Stephania yunnanensis]|uniref:Uncharacterized protein n=1 Tax=Stephania yunnanensis TaxID=152371 RepID=A0AAP0FAL6_9MAGN
MSQVCLTVGTLSLNRTSGVPSNITFPRMASQKFDVWYQDHRCGMVDILCHYVLAIMEHTQQNSHWRRDNLSYGTRHIITPKPNPSNGPMISSPPQT